jgi:hypothetical protein
MQGLTRDQLAEAVRKKIPRPLFATQVGDHHTGVAAQDAAYSLSGAMAVPLQSILGLRPVSELKERQVELSGWQLQLTFLDLKPSLDRVASTTNTAMLETIFSPHVVVTGEEHEQLKKIARSFLGKHCFHDFMARARVQRQILEDAGEGTAPLRHLLEAARLYLSGSRLMQAGELESNILRLLEHGNDPWLRPFLERQQAEGLAALLKPAELRQAKLELGQMEAALQTCHMRSRLPEEGGSISSLDEFLIDFRLREIKAEAGLT